jgi:hypothetical protein
MVHHPAPALAITRARLLEESDQPGKASEVLALYSNVRPDESTEWGLYAHIADELLRLGNAEGAWQIYQNLDKVKMPDTVRLAFRRRGIQCAEKAGDTRTAAEWELLVNPPSPEPVDLPDDAPVSDKPSS